MSYLLRNPATLRVTFVNSAFVSFLVLALFYNVGNEDTEASFYNTRIAIYNWVGLSFMLTTNVLMPAIAGVVLQMPI